MNVESFKNNKTLDKFINKKKVENIESPLNSYNNTKTKTNGKTKDKFIDAKGKGDNIYDVYKHPILKKNYKSSITSFSKKMPVYIEIFKNIIK